MEVNEIVSKIKGLSREDNFIVIKDTEEGGIFASTANVQSVWSAGGVLFTLDYGSVKYGDDCVVRLDYRTLGTLTDVAKKVKEVWDKNNECEWSE